MSAEILYSCRLNVHWIFIQNSMLILLEHTYKSNTES